MNSYTIIGGNRLNGEINIRSAKNSVLPIIACCLLSSEDIIIQNVPDILDIQNMINIMRGFGTKIEFRNNNLYINCANAAPLDISNSITGLLRSSIFLLGPIVSRFRKVKLGLPGGCAIGARPIDLHIDGLKALGVSTHEKDGYIDCTANKIIGGRIKLRFPSVGATENIMMAACLSYGTTAIYNAALEPEIVDLANFINTLGGRVFGAGTSSIIIEGVKKLHGGIYKPYGDRIAAPTYLAAGIATKGRVIVRGLKHNIITSTLNIFAKIGAKVIVGNDYVSASCNGKLKAIEHLQTAPHPYFATDMQAQVAALLVTAKGKSAIQETVFENRFVYANELNKMGANTAIDKNKLKIMGVDKLKPATLKAHDLRGGAAVVIAALTANGKSIVEDVKHIERGYEKFDEGLRRLGANIIKN